MNDSTLAALAPGLDSLGLGIETSPRLSSPLLCIAVGLWRCIIAIARRGQQRTALR